MKYRRAVFIVTYSRTKKGVEYLVLKRKLHWKGWEFPKGGIDFLETKRQAVKRELFEETGLRPLGKIKKFNFSGKYKYPKRIEDRGDFVGQTFSLYAAEVKKLKAKFDKYEHSDFRWVTFEKALKLLKWSNQRKSLKIVDDWLRKNEI